MVGFVWETSVTCVIDVYGPPAAIVLTSQCYQVISKGFLNLLFCVAQCVGNAWKLNNNISIKFTLPMRHTRSFILFNRVRGITVEL
jgi:hypothetical protein